VSTKQTFLEEQEPPEIRRRPATVFLYVRIFQNKKYRVQLIESHFDSRSIYGINTLEKKSATKKNAAIHTLKTLGGTATFF